MNDSRRRLGFTLIELLVVILIVGILVGITLPAIQRVRESARRTSCMNQVRQCTLAVLNFETSHRQLPSAISTENDIYPLQSWLQKILPFLEREAIYRQAVSDYRSNRSPFEGHVGMQTVVSNFHCPSEPNSGEAHWTHQDLLVASTNYLGVSGLNWQSEDGVLYKDS